MAGVLKIVCTPIGNLGDISRRAIETLQNCILVLAEDTRHSQKLFHALNISLKQKKFVSCNQHNEQSRASIVFERLQADEDVALISDAGAPTISDPGGKMVQAVVEGGYKIEVIPGASAVTAALIGAGLDTTRYVFLGFLPRKGTERMCLVKNTAKLGFALVIFESALRVSKTLSDLAKWCGPKKVAVARELTKLYETFHRGVLGAKLSPEFVVKGEVVIVVEAGQAKDLNDDAPQIDIYTKALELVNSGKLTPKQMAKSLGLTYGVRPKEAYKLVVGLKNGQ